MAANCGVLRAEVSRESALPRLSPCESCSDIATSQLLLRLTLPSPRI
jgi:hypothetical protein